MDNFASLDTPAGPEGVRIVEWNQNQLLTSVSVGATSGLRNQIQVSTISNVRPYPCTQRHWLTYNIILIQNIKNNLYLIIVSKLFLMESTNLVTFSLLELNKHLLHFHTGSDRWKDSGSKCSLHFGHKIADKKVPFSVGSWHKLHWQIKNLESFNVFNLFWVLISKLQ